MCTGQVSPRGLWKLSAEFCIAIMKIIIQKNAPDPSLSISWYFEYQTRVVRARHSLDKQILEVELVHVARHYMDMFVMDL